MRILVIGATGTIGKEVVAALKGRHEIVPVTHKSSAITVELGDVASIRSMLALAGKVDAIVSAAGEAKFAPLAQLSDEDFRFSLANKLMGQANLIRYGFQYVGDGGSITVTSGVLATKPMPGSGAISLVNAGLEGFVRAAALESPRNIRVNVVSPPWVSETLTALGMDPSQGLPAAVVAKAYVKAIEGKMSGSVIEPEK